MQPIVPLLSFRLSTKTVKNPLALTMSGAHHKLFIKTTRSRLKCFKVLPTRSSQEAALLHLQGLDLYGLLLVSLPLHYKETLSGYLRLHGLSHSYIRFTNRTQTLFNLELNTRECFFFFFLFFFAG